MFPRAFRAITVGGVDVRVDPSWFLIAAAIVYSYHRTFTADGRSLSTAIAMALVAAILFTASVLIHELAHAFEGRHRGAEVGGITLFLLGGATAMHAADRRARDELAIAAIGPWSNVVLAAAFGLIATFAAQRDVAVIADVAGLMGWLNLGLAIFNLVPGAPLDGGRVLRAVIWAVTGDRHRATTLAAGFGLVFASALLALAGWLLVTERGGLVAAGWIGAIAAYMLHAARGELQRGRLGRWLAGHSAADLAPAAPVVAADAPLPLVSGLVSNPAQPPRAWLVTDADGRPSGVLVADDLASVTAEDLRTSGSLARSLDGIPVLAADARGDELANLLDRDQPFVLRQTDAGVVLSSLDAIDRAVHLARTGRASDAPAVTT